MLPLVAGHPGLEERPADHHAEQQERQRSGPGISTFQEIVWPNAVRLPVGHDPQQPLGHAHVPVGLGAGRHLRRIVGPVLPDRVDRQQAAHQRGDAEDHEEEAAGLGHVDREHRVAHDVLLGPAGPGPLGVLVEDQQQHVRADQRQQQARDQQHVDRVEPRDDHVARELAAEQEERHVGADHRASPSPGRRRSAGRCRRAGRRAGSSRRSPR